MADGRPQPVTLCCLWIEYVVGFLNANSTETACNESIACRTIRPTHPFVKRRSAPRKFRPRRGSNAIDCRTTPSHHSSYRTCFLVWVTASHILQRLHYFMSPLASVSRFCFRRFCGFAEGNEKCIILVCQDAHQLRVMAVYQETNKREWMKRMTF